MRLGVIPVVVPATGLDKPVIAVEVEALTPRYRSPAQPIARAFRPGRPDVSGRVEATCTWDADAEFLGVSHSAGHRVTERVERDNHGLSADLACLDVLGIDDDRQPTGL